MAVTLFSISNELEICKEALLRIGQSDISSLGEGSLPAKYCNMSYNQARQHLLSKYNWTFATNREVLNLKFDNSSEDESLHNRNLFEFKRMFSIPADFLRLIEVYDAHDTPVRNLGTHKNPFRLESGYILTDLTKCKIRYIYDLKEVAKFSPQFKECLILEIAIKLTKLFNDSGTYLQQLQGELEMRFQEAKISDTQQTMIESLNMSYGRYSF